MRLNVQWRCIKWANCTTRKQFGYTRCFWRGQICDGLISEIHEHGREGDFDTEVQSWGKYSLVITVPARIAKNLDVKKGDSVHIIIRKNAEEDAIARTVSRG